MFFGFMPLSLDRFLTFLIIDSFRLILFTAHFVLHFETHCRWPFLFIFDVPVLALVVRLEGLILVWATHLGLYWGELFAIFGLVIHRIKRLSLPFHKWVATQRGLVIETND
jgi:hypothetical protein